MIIVYGYYIDESSELIGKTLDTQGTIIALKPLDRVGDTLIFAALIDTPSPIRFPANLNTAILVKQQFYTHKPYKPHLANATNMNAKQRKSYCKKLLKLRLLDARTWKLHISRNRGIKWVRKYLHRTH
ncbi:hypothetical protein [Vibrio ouci]|uniref:Uncharacterized protein n=1 Tax=Vibrio ouci TaxID=2499078 RepID=A0A4Y8W9U0_9VIBR|nr:hypothetical protein [Vibrio ouci]TFH89373.1 hypothetical protein ELS82_22645 [Vibrio ouci]